jgi:DNA-binding CsgD family transcriptional regulator
MSLDESHLLRLAVAAYDSAAHPEIWPQFLEQYSKTVGARMAFVQRHHPTEGRSDLLHTFGITRVLNAEYAAYYSRVNVWRLHGERRQMYVPVRTFVDDEVYPRPLLKRSEFYNDCLRLHGVARCFTGVVACRAGQAVTLTALRADRDGPFDTTSLKALAFLLPHVTRAEATMDRLASVAVGEAALNALDVGVVLLASDRRIVFVNRCADGMLRAGDGWLRRHDRLTATEASADAALQRLLRYAIAPDASLGCPPDVLVPRPSGRRPYHVMATPLRTQPAAFIAMRTPVVVVLVTDREARQPRTGQALQHAYALTPREAMLAAALADGQSLADAADRLGMRYETARTHLRRVLSKTETSRQAQLVLLVERVMRSVSLRDSNDD